MKPSEPNMTPFLGKSTELERNDLHFKAHLSVLETIPNNKHRDIALMVRPNIRNAKGTATHSSKIKQLCSKNSLMLRFSSESKNMSKYLDVKNVFGRFLHTN